MKPQLEYLENRCTPVPVFYKGVDWDTRIITFETADKTVININLQDQKLDMQAKMSVFTWPTGIMTLDLKTYNYDYTPINPVIVQPVIVQPVVVQPVITQFPVITADQIFILWQLEEGK